MNKTSIFDERAMQWDVPQRLDMAEGIAGAMIREVPFNKDMTVIDFGAGTGLITLALSPLVKKVIAVDSSVKMLEAIKEKLSSMDIKNVERLHSEYNSEEFLSLKVNAVASSMTLHHIQDYRELCRAFFSVLEPGGSIALADLEKEDGSFHSDNMGVCHYGFDKNEIVDALADAGFVSVSHDIAHSVIRNRTGEDKKYDIFLVTAKKGASQA